MPFKKKNPSDRIYSNAKKDKTVGYGKYTTKQLNWVAKNDPEYFKTTIKELYYNKYDFVKKHFYDQLYKRFFQNIDLYTNKRQDIVDVFIKDKQENGVGELVIKRDLKRQYQGISESFLAECAKEARDVLRKEFEIEREFLVDIHILRYEELFVKAFEPDLSKIPPQYHNAMKAESLMNAIEILAQKERTLGIHTRNFKIQINNYIQTKKRKEAPSINLDNLSFVDQINLLHLIESSKISDTIYKPIVQSTTTEQEVVDITIKEHIEAPIRQSKQTDMQAERDLVISKEQGKTLIDIQEKMRESLRKQVEEAYKKQGK